jgi:hypothetical protein
MITLIYRYECGFCTNAATDTHEGMPTNGELPRPCAPDGWLELGGNLVCPAHEVTLGPKAAA